MEVDWNILGQVYQNGRGLIPGGVSLKDGKIVKIGKQTNLPKASNTFQRQGATILPGLIDCHVHLRGLKLSYKEDFYTGTCAAAVGGFTTVLDMPNTKPPTNSPERLRDKISEASQNIVVDIGCYILPPEHKIDYLKLSELGPVSVKVYLPELENPAKLSQIATLCKKMRIPLTIHAESRRILEETDKQVCEENSLEAFCHHHSPRVEVEGVRESLKTIGNKSMIHFSHISSEEALHLLEDARSRGIRYTAEVTPHHLILTSTDFKRVGSRGLMTPPLRRKHDTEALWKGIQTQSIDVIGSDHAPHTLQEKTDNIIWKIPPGIPGLETTLPLLLTCINQKKLRLNDLVRLLAEKPASIFNLTGKGAIEEGFQGDLTVVNLNAKHSLNPDTFKSKAKYSPFSGFKCKGKPIATFVNGILVAEDGEIQTSPGSGRVIKPCRRENSS